MSIEAMKLALDWFEKDGEPDHHPVVEALRQAIEQAQKRPQNCGTGYCSCIECVMEPEKQEPMQCWKCGDMDADFQAKCAVPACGIKEKNT